MDSKAINRQKKGICWSIVEVGIGRTAELQPRVSHCESCSRELEIRMPLRQSMTSRLQILPRMLKEASVERDTTGRLYERREAESDSAVRI